MPALQLGSSVLSCTHSRIIDAAGAQGVQHVKAAFYALRFLLGAAESGTMPGMWFHASLFYSGNVMHLLWSMFLWFRTVLVH